jgi:hypothetical protein
MIIAVVAVAVVQPPRHQVVEVVAVRDDFMPAAVVTAVAGQRRAGIRVGGADGDDVFIVMPVVSVVQVAVVQVIDMTVMQQARVTAGFAVDVGMAIMGMVRHGIDTASQYMLFDACNYHVRDAHTRQQAAGGNEKSSQNPPDVSYVFETQ